MSLLVSTLISDQKTYKNSIKIVIKYREQLYNCIISTSMIFKD